MFRPWRSFPLMVSAGLVLGLATGGYPAYSREISQLALLVAMTFSLTEISFAGISPRAEARGILLALGMSYAVLSGLLLVFAAFAGDSGIHDGWVLMAAVPPAVAVIPITSLLKGDVRRSLISSAVLYLLGLALVPGLTLVFAGRSVPPWDLFLQTLLLIGLPLVLSRPLRRVARIDEVRPTAVGLSFFFLVLAIAGSTRAILFTNPQVLAPLAALSFVRTFGLGIVLFAVAGAVGASRSDQIAATTFSSFKNLGLTVVLAFAFFGPEATLPSIVSLVFEILWIAALPLVFLRRAPPAL
ncbi:MAG: hypothetical protein A3K59_08140 [Euryarchaeota archaeon RBG_19FT_COMBO_69_17]|nr:MAG: hypothetical protein A3K59_08140 [Euryarchaeota archaeon RBG_19FT_COMBO_69_17]